MTTQIHIVNFGPDPVIVKTTDKTVDSKLYPKESLNVTIWPGKDVVVSETKGITDPTGIGG
jgi:hypothetical protein